MPRSSASTSPKASKVTKRSSYTRATRFSARQKSKLAAESSHNASLERMVEEATQCQHVLQYGDNSLEQDPLEETTIRHVGREGVSARKFSSQERNEEQMPLMNSRSEERPFPLMSLPAEIRNEIYRACLTRPFNVLLSKKETLPRLLAAKAIKKDESSPGSGHDEPMNGAKLSELLGDVRADRPAPSTRSGRHHARLTRGDTTALPDAHALRILRPRLAPVPPNSHDSNDGIHPASSRGDAPGPSQSPTSSLTPSSINATIHFEKAPRVRRLQKDDPLLVNILRLNKQVYQEARSILYSENCFTLDLDTATSTLAALHQRSRRQIKYIELEIPCYNEILERFQETVRLSLRYCWGLRTLVIHMPFTLPGTENSGHASRSMSAITSCTPTVYANGFDILRWLPRQCEVVLRGKICQEVLTVVSKNANLAKSLDELAYARRQLVSNEPR